MPTLEQPHYAKEGQALRSGSILGVPVVAAPASSVSRRIIEWAQFGASKYVCLANVHMTTSAKRNPELLRVVKQADLVLADGKPLVWCLHRQGLREADHIRGADLTLDLCRQAEIAGVPVYFFGGSKSTIHAVEKSLERRFPRLQVVGCHAPPKLADRPALDRKVVGEIRASGAKIIFVGLGCPKQDYWMAQHSPHLPAVLLGVGAAFDFIAGTLPQAPAWMSRIGLEWLFRLCLEPRRLWRRYLVSNSLFAWHIIRGDLGGQPGQGDN